MISNQDSDSSLYERGIISCSWEYQQKAIRRSRMLATKKVVIPKILSASHNDAVREEMLDSSQQQPKSEILDDNKQKSSTSERKNIISTKQVSFGKTLDEQVKEVVVPAVAKKMPSSKFLDATADATESTAAEEEEEVDPAIVVETTKGKDEPAEAATKKELSPLDFGVQEKYLQSRRASSFRKPQVTMIPGGATTMSIKERMRIFQAKS